MRHVIESQQFNRKTGVQAQPLDAGRRYSRRAALYLALQMYGYAGDAHEVINHKALPLVTADQTLVQAVKMLTVVDPELQSTWGNIPRELHELFQYPESYIGRAREKFEETYERANAYLAGC